MVSGIIAEFNIFHNGHKYLIEQAQKQSDAVVAVMSGPFVQRGDVAVTDKWSRAKAALLNGVDLVLELPVCYALNAAPNFAVGGVNTLAALGVVDTLVFGSESGDTSELQDAARILENETEEISNLIKEYMSSGITYPAAMEKAYSGRINPDLLSQPNNILAVEYIRAIMRYGHNITPMAIKRRGATHNDSGITEGFTSASKLREMLICGEDITKLIPYELSDIGFTEPYTLYRLDSAFTAHLRTTKADELSDISEVSEGLENRILSVARDTDNFDDLAMAVKNKRYTMSKIRRTLIASLLGFTKDIYSPLPDYIRVLGMNQNGAELLRKAKKICKVPIITKAADFKMQSKQFELDKRASDIAALCSGKDTKAGADFTHSPVII